MFFCFVFYILYNKFCFHLFSSFFWSQFCLSPEASFNHFLSTCTCSSIRCTLFPWTSFLRVTTLHYAWAMYVSMAACSLHLRNIWQRENACTQRGDCWNNIKLIWDLSVWAYIYSTLTVWTIMWYIILSFWVGYKDNKISPYFHWWHTAN